MQPQPFYALVQENDLNEQRLNAAADALRSGSDTVLAIAEQCGFENLSYFNRLFKKRYGMTPREYRGRK